MVLEREHIMTKFQEVTAELEQALSAFSFEKLDITHEVKEQAELVLAQFRRAKGRVDAPDVELYEDLLCLYNKNNDASEDPHVLRRLVDKLQLGGIADLTQESLALHEMVAVTDGDPGENIEKMSMLLKKVKDFVQTVNPNIASEKPDTSSSSRKTLTEGIQKNLVIPDDFRCPISLELMKDPVIVSTGQGCNNLVSEKSIRPTMVTKALGERVEKVETTIDAIQADIGELRDLLQAGLQSSQAQTERSDALMKKIEELFQNRQSTTDSRMFEASPNSAPTKGT
ncbi:hypothetical protein OROGR_002483 [Orobanche gracilis]